ncbi:MAG: hypothetical protein CVT88_05535, partial [Candidatus Altiarchaeales archaeon HGW-Altiarchaeales-1]
KSIKILRNGKNLGVIFGLIFAILILNIALADVSVSSIITDNQTYNAGDVVKIEFNVTVVDQSGACALDSVNFSITDGNSLSCSLPILVPYNGPHNCSGYNINVTLTQKYDNCNQYGGNSTYYYVIFWQIPNNWNAGKYNIKASTSAGGKIANNTASFNVNKILNSNISNSTIIGYYNVNNSEISGSTLQNNSVMNSNIINSTLPQGAYVINATINNSVLIKGTIEFTTPYGCCKDCKIYNVTVNNSGTYVNDKYVPIGNEQVNISDLGYLCFKICTNCGTCYTNTAGICTINTGENCTCINQALNDANCNEVRMQSDIINWSGTCIDNPAGFNNKVFDCQGHTIDGDDIGTDYGIYLDGKTENVIKNCMVSDFKYGIRFSYSSNNTITNSTINSNWDTGIFLFTSSNNNLSDNIVNSNSYGIDLFNNSNFNKISNNRIFNNSDIGIEVSNQGFGYGFGYGDGNANNTIEGNNISSNGIGIYSQNSTSTINNNYVCGNTNLDFNSSDWLSSSGDNNTCNNSNGWNDTSSMNGCSWLCGKTKIYGHIIDSETNMSIQNTLVELYTKCTPSGILINSTHTNSSGYFEFTLEQGNYCIKVSKEEYIPNTMSILIYGGDHTNLTISLAKSTYLEVCVYDDSEMPVTPLNDTLVKIYNGSILISSNNTNASGCVRFFSLASGNYTFYAEKEGHINNSSTYSYNNDSYGAIYISLRPMPDLYVGASMPLSGKQNQEISINLTVKNDAGIYVQELKNVSVLFKVVLNGTIIINETKYINMSNKYFNQLSFSFIPTNFGNYTIEITADSLNVIAESNESNNKISRNISVEEEDYNFMLVVVDNITNEPIDGAIIYVNGTAIGQTKINGIFTYKLQQGEYGIMITKDKYVNYFEKVNISGKTQINAGLYRKVYNLFKPPSEYELFINTTTVPGYIQNVYCCIKDDGTQWYPDTCTVNISECSCPGGVTNYHCYNTGGLGGLKKIHPNDEQLRKYSYTYPNYFFYNYTIYNNSFLNISNYGFSADKFVPEFSSKYTKEDVSRQMKVISDGYIKNYDYDCTSDCNNIPDNLYKERKCDGKCEAWHASDYEIINKEEGVCEDWAVLSVSFASSYGLPARYVTVWKRVWNESAQKWQDGGGHALLEVFNATGNGMWIHLDTLWGEFNNPFKYDNSKGWEGEVFRACAYYPNGTLMEDVTWKYSKIHASGNCWNYPGKAYMGTSNISNNADNFTLPQTSESPPGDLPSNFIPGNRTYKITIKTNTTAEFNAIIQLSSIGTDTINVKYNNGTLNDTELKQEIIDTLELQNITPITLTKENLNDTSKQIILNAVFDVQIVNYTFSHNFVTSQFDRLKYIVNSNVDVEFVNPSPDNSENGFAWNFDANNPGSHEIRIYLTKPRTYFVLPSGVSASKVREMLADVVANKINGTVITEDNITNISNADVTYILGDYFEISSEQERQIQNRSRETYRITGSDVLLSKQLAPMFWQDTSNAVIVHPDNYNEVELAKNYSIQQKSPLILTDKLLNDDTCSQDTQCESNHCVHNICRSTSPFCGDNFCDPGENATNCPVDCNKATDIFDAVEMLEYLSENKNLSRNRTYYKFANYDDDINLPDVFALIENIVTEQ